jgi:cytochrome c-type biogenesis protein CcmH
MLHTLALALALLAGGLAQAKPTEASSASANPALEARMMALASELRCLVCQNQTIADSHAELAEDLRNQIRDMLARNMSDEEIMRYMTDRYGDFVLYRPPFKGTTLLLWLGPAVLMLGALASLVLVLRRRQRMPPEAFDPDTPDEPDARHDTSR